MDLCLKESELSSQLGEIHICPVHVFCPVLYTSNTITYSRENAVERGHYSSRIWGCNSGILFARNLESSCWPHLQGSTDQQMVSKLRAKVTLSDVAIYCRRTNTSAVLLSKFKNRIEQRHNRSSNHSIK